MIALFHRLKHAVLFYFKHRMPKRVVGIFTLAVLIVAGFIVPFWVALIFIVAMVAVIVAVLVLAEMGGVDDRGPLG